MEKQEFIQKATVKVLRLNDDLLSCPTVLVFRVHDIIEVDQATSHSYDPPPSVNIFPLPLDCYCSESGFFTRILLNAMGELNLFHQDNRRRIFEAINRYFHSCFNCSYVRSTSPKLVVVIEVLRKFVSIGDGEREGEFSVDIVHHEEEDYSETELQDILGSIYSLTMNMYHFPLSTNASTETYRFSHVNAAIRMFICNGKSSEDECPICLERLCEGQQIAEMPCFHKFHKRCAFRWLFRRASSCPLCRSVCKTPII